MTIISLHDITKTFGPRQLFDCLSLSLFARQKVGLIGANGTGKTTLLRFIMGSQNPDTGMVNIRKGLKIGYLPQEPSFNPDSSVMEVMHEGVSDLLKKQQKLELLSQRMENLNGKELRNAMAEFDRLAHEFELCGGWNLETRIKSVLAGVGLPETLYNSPTAALSGGQLARLGLAQVLLHPFDILLLDEPTNHLDLQATCWLETFLKNYPGAVLLISHDRYLLDQLTERTIEIENGRAVSFKGNYSHYLQEKQKAALFRQREYEARTETVSKTLDFIARNKDQEGMRKTARGRKKRLERLLAEQPDYLERPSAEKTISFRFEQSSSRSEKILNVTRLAKSFEDLLLFDNITFELSRGQRLAITGPNGTGKSTLIKIIIGELAPTGGSVEIGKTLKIGYLDQNARSLDPDRTVLEEAASVRPDLPAEALRNRLAPFLFRGDEVFQKIATLSGGQQNRLMLCKLVLAEPDLLVLDEPTNHLDIAGRQALEEAIKQYSGSIVLVSHDRYFLDRVADLLLVLGMDSCGCTCLGSFALVQKPQDRGAFSEWSAGVSLQNAQPASGKTRKPSTDKLPAARTPPDLRKFNKLRLEDLESDIENLESKIAFLQEQFGKADVYKNPEAIKSLTQDLEQSRGELVLMYKAYELRMEK